MSCRQYSELASRKLDDIPLSLPQRVQYAVHKVLCLMCRRFERQIALIERAALRYRSQPMPETEVALGAEAKDRIRSALTRCGSSPNGSND
ncbi:MAG: hypothetical protein KDD64_06945 [Bdellovibrionales bacterium]|nr:hypothetical protein [Bdellovibrionales bacterium]